jgi:hypothetical protein
MSVDDDGTWNELWPDSYQPVAAELERYRDRPRRGKLRSSCAPEDTSLQYVDIVAIETLNGEHLKPRPVDSV